MKKRIAKKLQPRGGRRPRGCSFPDELRFWKWALTMPYMVSQDDVQRLSPRLRKGLLPRVRWLRPDLLPALTPEPAVWRWSARVELPTVVTEVAVTLDPMPEPAFASREEFDAAVTRSLDQMAPMLRRLADR